MVFSLRTSPRILSGLVEILSTPQEEGRRSIYSEIIFQNYLMMILYSIVMVMMSSWLTIWMNFSIAMQRSIIRSSSQQSNTAGQLIMQKNKKHLYPNILLT